MHVSLRGSIGTGFSPELSFLVIRPRNGNELIAAPRAIPGDAKNACDLQNQSSRSVMESNRVIALLFDSAKGEEILVIATRDCW